MDLLRLLNASGLVEYAAAFVARYERDIISSGKEKGDVQLRRKEIQISRRGQTTT